MKGAAMIEYVLLASMIALALVSAVTLVTNPATDKFGVAKDAIRNAVTGNPPP